ncbi:hypothetical protein K438DRAFT_1948338, partial [Mycena galopus ATCC 62051]
MPARKRQRRDICGPTPATNWPLPHAHSPTLVTRPPFPLRTPRLHFEFERVATWHACPPSLHTPIVDPTAFLTCARIGAIHRVVFAGFSAESLPEHVNDCTSRVLITSDEGKRGGKSIGTKAIVDQVLGQCPKVERSCAEEDGREREVDREEGSTHADVLDPNHATYPSFHASPHRSAQSGVIASSASGSSAPSSPTTSASGSATTSSSLNSEMLSSFEDSISRRASSCLSLASYPFSPTSLCCHMLVTPDPQPCARCHASAIEHPRRNARDETSAALRPRPTARCSVPAAQCPLVTHPSRTHTLHHTPASSTPPLARFASRSPPQRLLRGADSHSETPTPRFSQHPRSARRVQQNARDPTPTAPHPQPHARCHMSTIEHNAREGPDVLDTTRPSRGQSQHEGDTGDQKHQTSAAKGTRRRRDTQRAFTLAWTAADVRFGVNTRGHSRWGRLLQGFVCGRGSLAASQHVFAMEGTPTRVSVCMFPPRRLALGCLLIGFFRPSTVPLSVTTPIWALWPPSLCFACVMVREKYAKIWTPRLCPYEEDKALFTEEPFASVFIGYMGRQTTTRRDLSLWERLNERLHERDLVDLVWLIENWLCFTLGAAIVDHMPPEAVQKSGELFVEVLYTRFMHNGSPGGDELALKLLEAAQMDNFKKYYQELGDLPADFSFGADIDRRESWDSDSEAGDRDSDWESVDDDDPDYEEMEDYPMEGGLEGGLEVDSGDEDATSISDPDELLKFVKEPTHGNLRILPRVPLMSDSTDLPNSKEDRCIQRWVSHMKAFFHSDSQKQRSAWHVVQDLVEMRAITRTVYKGPDFQRALKDQGLFDMLHAIARPGNLLETSHVDVEESFQWYDWKVSYAELIVRWVEPTRTQEEYDKITPPSNPHFKFSAELAMDLLMFIRAKPRIHPWSFNPAAVYLFMSLGCFVANCETWLVPCLRELQYQHLEGWDSEVVYRALIRLPVFQKSSEHSEILDRLDACLAAIIRETSDHRQFMKSLTEELYRSRAHLDRSPPDESDQELSPPSESPQNSRHPANLKARKVAQQQQVLQNPGQRAKREVLGAQPKLKKIVRKGCRCEGLPMEHHCIRIIEVKPRKCKHLIGAALTCAP